MSKGPGKWQRAILATLADHEAFWLRSMLKPSCTKAEYNALLRAALKLEAAGLIGIERWLSGGGKDRIECYGRTAIRRIGTAIMDRRDVVNVGKVSR